MVGDSKVSRDGAGGRGRPERPGRYAPLARDVKFLRLRRRFLRAAAAITAVFFGWYAVYVGLSAFARGFMARQVAGHVNVALLLGLLQFASTFLLAWGYVMYARRRLDPLAAELRSRRPSSYGNGVRR
ncbi:DUF485 domain-containing protein [Actinomadura opuntiae]|uniref:DUF485 domain-containing protein n=1 Tax=Actinomadura sp. OS1-43 TaxID=604315 RepID=UPI00255B2E8D|nr:DUF485 domain-containing protein [Actinomadura sp. OS1-43]MDL4821025.1 DUF485 domain-containing protein [Actinomadura sp. OS1-43]